MLNLGRAPRDNEDKARSYTQPDVALGELRLSGCHTELGLLAGRLQRAFVSEDVPGATFTSTS